MNRYDFKAMMHVSSILSQPLCIVSYSTCSVTRRMISTVGACPFMYA